MFKSSEKNVVVFRKKMYLPSIVTLVNCVDMRGAVPLFNHFVVQVN